MTEIRFIERDAAAPRRGRSGRDTAPSPEALTPLTRNVAHASIEQIDQTIVELQRIRDELSAEGARLTSELARYANWNQSLQETMRVISESLRPLASTR